MSNGKNLSSSIMSEFEISRKLTLLGRNITFLREQQGLTIVSIALDAGIPIDRYEAIEAGIANPFLEEIISLAECLKISIEVLVSGISEDQTFKLSFN